MDDATQAIAEVPLTVLSFGGVVAPFAVDLPTGTHRLSIMYRAAALILLIAVVPLPSRAHAADDPSLFGDILAKCQPKARGGTPAATIEKRNAQKREVEAKRREAEDAALGKTLTNPLLPQALAEARTFFWQGNSVEAEKRLLAIKRDAPFQIPECDALLARLALRKNPAMAKLVATALHTQARIDTDPIAPERQEAALVCLRANLMLAMQPSPEGAKLLAQLPKTPTFQGVPLVGDSLSFAHPEADWTPLHAVADRIAADCNGVKDPAVQLRQIEAALLAGDALVLCNRWPEAKEAYGFAVSQGAGHNQRATQQREYEASAVPSPIPAPLISEAQNRLGQLKALEEVRRLSLDFIRYRDAESQRLAGRIKEAISGYDLLLEEANARREVAIAAAQKEALENKRRFDLKAFEREPESPFEAAAICYRAKCRLHLGDDRNTRQGVAELEDFIKKDDLGLYRGEALLELAEAAADSFAFDATKPYLDRLETWVKNARAENRDAKFAALFSKLPPAAQEVVKPPEHEWHRDGWGKFIRQNPRPGELVNRWTCKWYLDDLEENLVLYQGFLLFIKGDKQTDRDAARSKWERIKELDPLCSHDAGSANPTNWTRLRVWCEHGQGYASMEEAASFKGSPIREMAALGDFYALTCRWSKAEIVGRKILGQRHIPQNLRDYGWLLVGSAKAWQGDRDDAYEAYRTALKTKENTPTEIRCWYALANLMRTDKDETKRQESKHMLGEMVAMKLPGEWGCKACVALAMIYKDQDKDFPGALDVLDAYPQSDDRWNKVITSYRRLTEAAMARGAE